MRSPECLYSRGKATPIVYGMPGRELFKQAERGAVRLGGCLVMGDGIDPTYYCSACDIEFIAERAGSGGESTGPAAESREGPARRLG